MVSKRVYYISPAMVYDFRRLRDQYGKCNGEKNLSSFRFLATSFDILEVELNTLVNECSLLDLDPCYSGRSLRRNTLLCA